MKKIVLVILGIGLFSIVGFSQKGNNKISLAGDIAIPSGDFKDFSSVGFGGTVKALYGIGKAGQVTLTSGYVTFTAKDVFKDLLEADKISKSIIPILAGYRHNFNGFYVEPQVGYGIYTGKIKGGELDGNESEGAFTWAAGAGYVFRNIELGALYQSGHKNGTSNASIGFRVAYYFSIGGAL